MKRAWEPTVLRVNFWHGQEPAVGDGLQTRTGRRYLIQRLRFGRPTKGKLGPLRALECVVLPKNEPVPGKVHQWEWSPRRRRRSGRR